MKPFWHKAEQRGRETLAVWTQHRPALTVAGTTPASHAADITQIDTLAQAMANARVAAKAARQQQRAAYRRIRLLTLVVPRLIQAEFAAGHPVQTALAPVWSIVPRSEPLNLRRAQQLLPVWQQADAALAARSPGETFAPDGTTQAAFAQWVTDYPPTVQATADAVAVFRTARAALKTHHRAVDQLNKRAYLKLKVDARTDAALATVLHASITREKTSGTRKRKP